MKRGAWTFLAAALAVPVHAQSLAPDGAYREAVTARHQGDPQRAADLLSPIVAADPANSDAQVQLGYALLALGRLDEAEEAFRAALRVSPDYADARLGLARIALQRGDRDAGLRELAPVDPSYPEARTLRAQLSEGPEDLRWSLEVDGSYSSVEGSQPDWREGAVQLRYRASESTAVSMRAEAASRFDNFDLYGELGIEQALSERLRVYVTAGGTPRADFRPRYQIGAGGSLRVGEGGRATVLTMDARQAEYHAGNVQTVTPGLEQYLAGGRLWLTARWINIFDEEGSHRAGYLVRADALATESLRLFAGLSDAPDTSEGVVVETRGYFGGASYDLDDRTTLRLSLAHEDRATGAGRTQLALGVGLRF